MSFQEKGQPAAEPAPCRLGTSRLLFRGPVGPLTGRYVAFLGGTESYGRFVDRPYPDRLQTLTGVRSVNFACLNAGVDAFLNTEEVIQASRGATLRVVQVLGAQNMTNRYYSVHPRRNDRFLRASPSLKSLFGEVDFTTFNFTRHMLATLRDVSPERFAILAETLKLSWISRMRQLLSSVGGPVVLLRMADHAPPPPGAEPRLDRDPLLVDAEMIAAVVPFATVHVDVRIPLASEDPPDARGLSPYQAAAAAEMPGPRAHVAVAEALAPVLRDLLQPAVRPGRPS